MQHGARVHGAPNRDARGHAYASGIARAYSALHCRTASEHATPDHSPGANHTASDHSGAPKYESAYPGSYSAAPGRHAVTRNTNAY